MMEREKRLLRCEKDLLSGQKKTICKFVFSSIIYRIVISLFLFSSIDRWLNQQSYFEVLSSQLQRRFPVRHRIPPWIHLHIIARLLFSKITIVMILNHPDHIKPSRRREVPLLINRHSHRRFSLACLSLSLPLRCQSLPLSLFDLVASELSNPNSTTPVTQDCII